MSVFIAPISAAASRARDASPAFAAPSPAAVSPPVEVLPLPTSSWAIWLAENADAVRYGLWIFLAFVVSAAAFRIFLSSRSAR